MKFEGNLKYLGKNAETRHRYGPGECCHHPEPVTVSLHTTSEPLLSLNNVWMRREDREILTDVNFTVFKGDFIAITGPNGGGKTTLLRIILGLLKPTRGKIIFESGRTSIGYLPQKNMIDAHFPLTVREVVKSGLLGSGGMKSGEKNLLVEDTLRKIELSTHADRPIGKLSGGQLQRVLLGRAIISNPSLLVLDEPLSYIDKHFESHIYRLIAEIAPHCTIMLVSHEMTMIATMANRHFIVDKTVTECGATHHYFTPECDVD